MEHICQSCQDLKSIKFILLEKQKIKLLCPSHRMILTQYSHLESIFKEGRVCHLLPDFQKKMSEINNQISKSIDEFRKNIQISFNRIKEKIKQFYDLKKQIFDLNAMYKDDNTQSYQMEQQLKLILDQFQKVFRLSQEKAFRIMCKIEPFDESINLIFQNLFILSL